jgi:hypothetical protein
MSRKDLFSSLFSGLGFGSWTSEDIESVADGVGASGMSSNVPDGSSACAQMLHKASNSTVENSDVGRNIIRPPFLLPSSGGLYKLTQKIQKVKI